MFALVRVAALHHPHPSPSHPSSLALFEALISPQRHPRVYFHQADRVSARLSLVHHGVIIKVRSQDEAQDPRAHSRDRTVSVTLWQSASQGLFKLITLTASLSSTIIHAVAMPVADEELQARGGKGDIWPKAIKALGLPSTSSIEDVMKHVRNNPESLHRESGLEYWERRYLLRRDKNLDYEKTKHKLKRELSEEDWEAHKLGNKLEQELLNEERKRLKVKVREEKQLREAKLSSQRALRYVAGEASTSSKPSGLPIGNADLLAHWESIKPASSSGTPASGANAATLNPDLAKGSAPSSTNADSTVDTSLTLRWPPR